MQATCRLHAACIRSYAGGCRLQQAHAACGVFSWRRRPTCRLQAGCMQGVDAKKIRREWTCSFSAYFSERIFLFLAYDSMFWCYRDVICDARDLHARRVYCLRLAKNGESAGKLWGSRTVTESDFKLAENKLNHWSRTRWLPLFKATRVNSLQ